MMINRGTASYVLRRPRPKSSLHLVLWTCSMRQAISRADDLVATAPAIKAHADKSATRLQFRRMQTKHKRHAHHGSCTASPFQDARLVQLSNQKQLQSWTLPGLKHTFPHDIAVAAASTALTGTGERLFALLVAPTCAPPGCGPLQRFVLAPVGGLTQVRYLED